MKKSLNIKRILSLSAILLLAFGSHISAQDIIGSSVENRPIYSYTIQGTGLSLPGSSNENKSNLIVIGGIHGGYEWNSVILVRDMLDHYSKNTDEIPSNIILYIIPVLNPDGLYRIAGEADPALLDESALRLERDKLLPCRFPDAWEPAKRLAEAYSKASGYKIYVGSTRPSGVPFTGTASGYLYNRGIPGIIIELSNRYDSELAQNIRGFNSLMQKLN